MMESLAAEALLLNLCGKEQGLYMLLFLLLSSCSLLENLCQSVVENSMV